MFILYFILYYWHEYVGGRYVLYDVPAGHCGWIFAAIIMVRCMAHYSDLSGRDGIIGLM